MKQSYILSFDKDYLQILDESRHSIAQALLGENRELKLVCSNDEIAQLQDILLLIKLGEIKTRWLHDANNEKILSIEINL